MLLFLLIIPKKLKKLDVNGLFVVIYYWVVFVFVFVIVSVFLFVIVSVFLFVIVSVFVFVAMVGFGAFISMV